MFIICFLKFISLDSLLSYSFPTCNWILTVSVPSCFLPNRFFVYFICFPVFLKFISLDSSFSYSFSACNWTDHFICAEKIDNKLTVFMMFLVPFIFLSCPVKNDWEGEEIIMGSGHFSVTD